MTAAFPAAEGASRPRSNVPSIAQLTNFSFSSSCATWRLSTWVNSWARTPAISSSLLAFSSMPVVI